jgi:acyl carrier protein
MNHLDLELSPTTMLGPLKSWLIAWLAAEQGVEAETINSGRSFLNYGLDSVQAMTLVGDLEAKLGRRLAPTLAWDYPTIDALAEHLAGPSCGTAEAVEGSLDRPGDRAIGDLRRPSAREA